MARSSEYIKLGRRERLRLKWPLEPVAQLIADFKMKNWNFSFYIKITRVFPTALGLNSSKAYLIIYVELRLLTNYNMLKF